MPDDFDDYDRRGDDFDRGPDDFDRRPAGGAAAVEAARRKAFVPGLLLMLVGGLTFALAGLNFVQKDAIGPQIDAELAKNEAKIDADPNLDADGKQKSKEMMKNIGDTIKQVFVPALYGMMAVGFLGLVGGLSLIRLSAYPLVMLAAIAFLIPVVTPCCIGMPFGIWALVAANGRVIREGYRLKGLSR